MSMSTSNNRAIKLAIVAAGGILIAVGVSPYFKSYLSEQDNIVLQQQMIEDKELLVAENPNNTEETGINVNEANNEQMNNNEAEVINSEADEIDLPTLYESDEFTLEKISPPTEQSLFIRLDIIRNIVVFIDNFSRGELVTNFSPLKLPEGKFTVTKEADSTYMSIDSYLRYDKYAKAVSQLDVTSFIDLYSLLTPLIDEAYQELGYPTGSFNETFIKAINNLLETPIIYTPLEVTSPSVMYKYADNAIESLPDTQKLMLRMGPDNLEMVKFKLLQVLNELQRL